MDQQPPKGHIVDTLGNGWAFYKRRGDGAWEDSGKFMSRYGKAGDIRYMREPLVRGFGDVAYYADDTKTVFSKLTGEPITWRWKVDKLIQLYMPKEAARTFKRYEFVRVERLQEISREDAKAEGVSNCWNWTPDRNPAHFERGVLNPYVANFSVLWDEINGERGYPWTINPWVWVIGYQDFNINEVEIPNRDASTSAITSAQRGEK